MLTFRQYAMFSALAAGLVPSCRQAPASHPVQVIPAASSAAVAAGEPLAAALERAGLSAPERLAVARALNRICDTAAVRVGDVFEISEATPSWKTAFFRPAGRYFYEVINSSGQIAARRLEKPLTRRTICARGPIRTSLWAGMKSQGLDDRVIMAFADIFAWQIDFLTETREGDYFKVVVDEEILPDGTTAGRVITAAQYISGPKTDTAFSFTDTAGHTDYYTPRGESLRSAFLKAPLQYSRISSFFSRRRFHPVLKYFRPHLGIDYAAPEGTPVSAIGEGTVTFAGPKGANGKFISIRHPNGFASMYGHLSGIARGVRAGARIAQGHLIGYVGSTGLASGPHLDFRVKRGGVMVNFLNLRFASARRLAGRDREAFSQTKKALYRRLAEITS